MPGHNQPRIGLRERKKIKTRAAIQQHALRLFRKQGYQATTVEQIAEAAEISPSTFFRYFPTKEAVVLDDDYDPMIMEAFRSQPPELKPLPAFRRSIRQVFEAIPEVEKQAALDRFNLTMSIPELKAAAIHQVAGTARMIAGLVAEQTGRNEKDLAVQNFAAAVIGSVISTQMYYAEHPELDFIELLDQALAHMEAGFPL